jgi:hypothetical protein
MTLVFKKNANFFAQYWQKSLKIFIITSTPAYGAFIQKIFPIILGKNGDSKAIS